MARPETTAVSEPGLTPVATFLKTHEEDKSRRAEVRKRNLSEQVRCLDPDYAANMIRKRPRFNFQVSCLITKMNDKGKRKQEKVEETVTAETEADAWALFCDNNKLWPSPGLCNRKIDQLSAEAA